VSPYNFGARWNIFTNLFQATWWTLVPKQKSYSAHVHLPELHVHCIKAGANSYATWFYDTVYVVIRQLPLLRDEFRISKLTFHTDLRRRAASRLALPCTSSSLLRRWRYINHLLAYLLEMWQKQPCVSQVSFLTHSTIWKLWGRSIRSLSLVKHITSDIRAERLFARET